MNKADKESAILFLKQNGINFDLYETEELCNMKVCLEFERKTGVKVFKNLLVQNEPKTETYMILMGANKKFKTATISKMLGVSRLSFAKADVVYNLLGVYPGSLTPLGLFFDKNNIIKVAVDKDLLKEEKLGLHPLENTAIVNMAVSDILNELILKSGHSYVEIEVNDFLV